MKESLRGFTKTLQGHGHHELPMSPSKAGADPVSQDAQSLAERLTSEHSELLVNERLSGLPPPTPTRAPPALVVDSLSLLPSGLHSPGRQKMIPSTHLGKPLDMCFFVSPGTTNQT